MIFMKLAVKGCSSLSVDANKQDSVKKPQRVWIFEWQPGYLLGDQRLSIDLGTEPFLSAL